MRSDNEGRDAVPQKALRGAFGGAASPPSGGGFISASGSGSGCCGGVRHSSISGMCTCITDHKSVFLRQIKKPRLLRVHAYQWSCVPTARVCCPLVGRRSAEPLPGRRFRVTLPGRASASQGRRQPPGSGAEGAGVVPLSGGCRSGLLAASRIGGGTQPGGNQGGPESFPCRAGAGAACLQPPITAGVRRGNQGGRIRVPGSL